MYWISGRGLSKDELKSMSDREHKKKKKERYSQHTEARATDLIDDETFAEKKAEILRAF